LNDLTSRGKIRTIRDGSLNLGRVSNSFSGNHGELFGFGFKHTIFLVLKNVAVLPGGRIEVALLSNLARGDTVSV
jgi:hypothetical protein